MTGRHITRFFAFPESVSGDVINLPSDEARHAIQVLRMDTGDRIEVVDGNGTLYNGVIERADTRQTIVRVLDRHNGVGEPSVRLWMGLPLLKQPSRQEFLVEKCTELGVHAFLPFSSAYTEGRRLKTGRLRRISIAAMKQSGRSRLPRIEETQPFEQLIAWRRAEHNVSRIICHESADSDSCPFPHTIRKAEPADVLVLVGPEGGFADEEIAAAKAAGFFVLFLGQRRLRSETAGVAVAALLADRLER